MEIDYRQLALAQMQLMAEGYSLTTDRRTWGGDPLVRRKGVVSGTPTFVAGHGAGGIFSTPGVNQNVFSTMILPFGGLMDTIPVIPTIETSNIVKFITAVDASSGTFPTNVCDPTKKAGLLRDCEVSDWTFGLLSMETDVVDIKSVGLRTNRAEPFDLRLVGGPNGGPRFFSPTMPGPANIKQVLNNEMAKLLFQMAVAWQRDFGRLLYIGDPANNTAGGGYKEFKGLDLLIRTGYVDRQFTGTACPAIDSIVESFGGVDIATDPEGIILRITSIYQRLRRVARATGLGPLDLSISMPEALFIELTKWWPCVYGTTRCSAGTDGVNAELDGTARSNMTRDMMGDIENRTGQYLLIDNVRVPVVLDDFIVEASGGGIPAGTYEADIYFTPRTVLGGIPVLYWEYRDWDTPGGPMDFARVLAPQQYTSSDGNRFLWHYRPSNNGCVQAMAWVMPRIVLLTPHLAARLTDVRYTPAVVYRNPFPGNANYVGGGVSSR